MDVNGFEIGKNITIYVVMTLAGIGEINNIILVILQRLLFYRLFGELFMQKN